MVLTSGRMKMINWTKLVEIYGKSQISQKDAFFMDEARFHGKCHSHEIVSYIG